MANLSRALALNVFRVHIENGFSVALGVGLTGLCVGGAFGFDAAIAAATGALCVSISDQPDPITQKPWVLGFAVVSAFVFAALSSFSRFWIPGFIAATAFTGLWTGLISVYGKRAQAMGMTSVLAFVFAMGQDFATPGDAANHLLLFLGGEIVFVTYAALVALLFDDRLRRLLLAEAMRAFAVYLRAKAAITNPDAEGPSGFHALIEAHAVLAERLQAARDAVFARRSSPTQLRRVDMLIALLDAFETVLSSDADMELLRRAPQRDLFWRLHAFVLRLADEMDRLTLILRSRHPAVTPHPHGEDARALAVAMEDQLAAQPHDPILLAFQSTANKLMLADRYIAALAGAIDRQSVPSSLAVSLDLDAFRAATPRGARVLLRQLTLASPALRYGVRLALALTAGLCLTLIFPRFAHANWVLLTIALIMRASYSVTRRRRWDRITGTLIGCALAVAFITFAPAPALLLLIILAIGTSHAYGGVAYRVTAVGASVSSLLLLHFVAPLLHPQFFERILDTLIGAGLSWAFSFLLPSWERDDLPATVAALLTADAAFAEAALTREHVFMRYRLARKRALDAVAQLAGVIRRLADEPNANRRVLAALNELLAANYLLASDLSSMPVLVKLRAQELDAATADSMIAPLRARVVDLLSPGRAQEAETTTLPRESLAGLQGSAALDVLARRLRHIEHSARKVARLAHRDALVDF
jgi:uncharacterized membrane protein YccC